MCSIHEELLIHPNKIEWVGFEKIILVNVILINPDPINADHYRYLPNNEFRNFVNFGHLTKLSKGIVENLVLYYLLCETYSIVTQDLEKLIMLNRERFFNKNHNKSDPELKEDTLRIIQQILNETNRMRPEFDRIYANISDYFSEITIWELFFESLSKKFE
jgi:hypothetical protein